MLKESQAVNAFGSRVMQQEQKQMQFLHPNFSNDRSPTLSKNPSQIDLYDTADPRPFSLE